MEKKVYKLDEAIEQWDIFDDSDPENPFNDEGAVNKMVEQELGQETITELEERYRVQFFEGLGWIVGSKELTGGDTDDYALVPDPASFEGLSASASEDSWHEELWKRKISQDARRLRKVKAKNRRKYKEWIESTREYKKRSQQ